MTCSFIVEGFMSYSEILSSKIMAGAYTHHIMFLFSTFGLLLLIAGVLYEKF